MSGPVGDASLQDAYESGIPVEGRVEAERKGGFTVKVANRDAFCPYSQIDIYPQDAALYLGQRLAFRVVEFAEAGRNIVLSRRRLLEQERARQKAELQERLQVGDVVPATVTRLMPFGVFANLGGVEGLIPIGALSWGHVTDAAEILKEGEDVQVMIREIDWDRDRISLSLKHAAADPWNKLADESDYHVGTRCSGTVTNLAPFGAFVALEPGIEGLVHVSRLGAGRRVNHPSEVLSVDDRVEVSIESIDLERRRISLSMDDTIGAGIQAEDEDGEAVVTAGRQCRGVVDGIKEFGLFVRLPDGRTGLLHISQIELGRSANRQRVLAEKFPPGSELDVVIQKIDGERISLALPTAETEQVDLSSLRQGSEKLGSLGDVLDGLKL